MILSGRLGRTRPPLARGKRRARAPVYASGFLYQENLPNDHLVRGGRPSARRGLPGHEGPNRGLPPAEESPLLERLRNVVPDDVYLMADAWARLH